MNSCCALLTFWIICSGLMDHDYKSLAGFLSPYLEIEGIEAAALVSSEGLLVAAAGGGGLDLEARASYAPPRLASADRLSAGRQSGGERGRAFGRR